MAFAVHNLSVLAYANGFTLWHYKAGADSRRDVSGQGFFDTSADMVATGDMMMVSAADGAALLCLAGLPGKVTTAPMT